MRAPCRRRQGLPGPTAPTEQAGWTGRTGVEFAKETLERAGGGLAVLAGQGDRNRTEALGLRRRTESRRERDVDAPVPLCLQLDNSNK